MDLCFDTTPQVANACGISSDMSTNTCRCVWCISCVGNVWIEINARVRGARARACAFAVRQRERLHVAANFDNFDNAFSISLCVGMSLKTKACCVLCVRLKVQHHMI